jgi:Zn-dependent protease
MFGKGFKLFTLFGFEVRVDYSWIIIAVLVTWSLAVGLFPGYYPGLSAGTYWTMGIVGAIGLFAAIIFHELSHSLVARRYGLPIRGITLFVFGGIAHMEQEPDSPKTEFLMAIAGPIASILFGAVAWAVLAAGAGAWSRPVAGVLTYLWTVNWLLAAFNLLPAFPLDGGRALRAGLWKWKNNLRWATRISSYIGSGFAFLLMAAGFFSIFRGALVSGIWWILIGLFLRNASQMSYQRLLILENLQGEPVRRFMKQEVVTAPDNINLEDLVENYVYQYHHKMFPVVSDGSLEGCVSTREIKQVPREEWREHSVKEVTTRCSEDNTIGPQEDASRALALMHRTGNSRLMVVDRGQLVGIVSLKDLLKFLNLKMDLEQEAVGRNLRR